jgi:hypothetical protein
MTQLAVKVVRSTPKMKNVKLDDGTVVKKPVYHTVVAPLHGGGNMRLDTWDDSIAVQAQALAGKVAVVGFHEQEKPDKNGKLWKNNILDEIQPADGPTGVSIQPPAPSSIGGRADGEVLIVGALVGLLARTRGCSDDEAIGLARSLGERALHSRTAAAPSVGELMRDLGMHLEASEIPDRSTATSAASEVPDEELPDDLFNGPSDEAA